MLEGTKGNNVLPNGGESMIFSLKQTEKNDLVARPVGRLRVRHPSSQARVGVLFSGPSWTFPIWPWTAPTSGLGWRDHPTRLPIKWK